MFKKFKCCLEKLCSQENTHSKCKEEHYEVGISLLATLLSIQAELRVYFSGLTFSHCGYQKISFGLHFRFICLIHYADLTTRVDCFTAKNSALSKNFSDTFNPPLCQQDLIISRFLRKGAETRDALKKQQKRKASYTFYYIQRYLNSCLSYAVCNVSSINPPIFV